MTRWPVGLGGPVLRLRTQLLAAFAVVAVVALVAGGAAVVWQMLGYRAQVTSQRLRDAAVSAGIAGGMLERQGAPPETIATSIAAQVPLNATRVLVLDPTWVTLADASAAGTTPAAESFVGQRIDVPPPGTTQGAGLVGPRLPGSGSGLSPEDRVAIWRGDPAVKGAGGYLFVAGGGPPPGGGQLADQDRTRDPAREQGRESGPLQTGTQTSKQTIDQPRGQAGNPTGNPAGGETGYRVVLAVPQGSLPRAWQELAPGLAGAAAVALLAAAGAAWWLAGSIVRPIRALTRATERVARGEPHRPVPEEGAGEVVQLARGFNEMAREVERSQETLRSFVADASHELRTPLTAIQGFSQAVEDGVLEAPPPTRSAARRIHREAERMHRLVEDLLLLSKMEARDRSVVPRPVDVAELLDTLAQRLRPVVSQRRLRLELELPERLLAAGDAGQLEHLFGNLLDNATKYAPEGGTITVRGWLEAEGARGEHHERVSVAVHNTGSCIPPEALPHVFERFYRVDKSRARGVAGSGLGLAIAREVAERHGGTIRAESDPATGTTFVVTLPAAPAQVSSRARAQAA